MLVAAIPAVRRIRGLYDGLPGGFRVTHESVAERDTLTAECVLLYLVCDMYGPVNRSQNLSLLAIAEQGAAAARTAIKTAAPTF